MNIKNITNTKHIKLIIFLHDITLLHSYQKKMVVGNAAVKQHNNKQSEIDKIINLLDSGGGSFQCMPRNKDSKDWGI